MYAYEKGKDAASFLNEFYVTDRWTYNTENILAIIKLTLSFILRILNWKKPSSAVNPSSLGGGHLHLPIRTVRALKYDL